MNYSFGKSNCHKSLELILSKTNDKNISANFSRFWANYNIHLKSCSNEYLGLLLVNDVVKKINEKNWPEDLITHTVCCVKCNYRNWLEKQKSRTL